MKTMPGIVELLVWGIIIYLWRKENCTASASNISTFLIHIYGISVHITIDVSTKEKNY